MKGCWNCQRPFLYMIWSCVFFFFVFQVIYVVNYIYWFAYVKLFLYLWDEVHLFIVFFLFDMFLNLVCEYFIENFCMYVHMRKWFVILFLCWSITWFEYQGTSSFTKQFDQCSFYLYFVELFEDISFYSFLKIWYIYALKPFRPWHFRLRDFSLLLLFH